MELNQRCGGLARPQHRETARPDFGTRQAQFANGSRHLQSRGQFRHAFARHGTEEVQGEMESIGCDRGRFSGPRPLLLIMDELCAFVWRWPQREKQPRLTGQFGQRGDGWWIGDSRYPLLASARRFDKRSPDSTMPMVRSLCRCDPAAFVETPGAWHFLNAIVAVDRPCWRGKKGR